ncbi:transient receptor potential cation channel subfamily V member 6 [Lepisosteus oculatus]|uniref:transient receptor potential cation channel subfamily V member 6 n=1 Tax=Lepisosteus oculatus TaxID=7918 RepID=UPI00372348AF
MPPPLALTAPGQIGHWWSRLRFRLQHKKDWTQVLDETFLLQSKRIKDSPLFFAAKENDVMSIRKLLKCPSTDIFERGALGETALHVAVMFDNLEASVALIEGVPDLINEPMSSDVYEGMTAMHIAVLNQNVNLVRELIARGADVATPRVTGSYFKKRRKGLVYFGEHILCFASCVGNEEIVNMVIEAGANLRAQDYLGNTVLHILILQPNKMISCQIFDLLMAADGKTDRGVPLDVLPNFRGLTPFKLAAKEGNVVMFQHMVSKRRSLQWSLGPLSSYLYDLSEIDSWSDDCSVLELVVCSSKREARRILDVSPVRQLVSLKWNLYGKHYFRFLLLLYLLYIGTFTLCCTFRPLKPIPENYSLEHTDITIFVQKTLEESYISYEDHLRLVGEIISVVGALVILLLEIPDILRVGAKRYFGQTVLGGPFHVILITYACLVLVLLILRLSSSEGEAVVMALSLVLGWCNVMYFARGFEMLGPYVIMIQKIIFGDLTKFIWLSVLVLVGFSTALWMTYMTFDYTQGIPSYKSFPVSLFSQFELSMGMIDLPVDQTVPTPPIVHILHIMFSVVSCLLLLNLLIAMMSDTHWRVAQERDELWRAQVVATTIMLERRLPRCMWPQMGICGQEYGLGDRQYLRVEDHRSQAMKKIWHYANAFLEKGEGLGEKEQGRENDLSAGRVVFRSRQKGRTMLNRKSLGAWEMIRRSALGSEHGLTNLDAVEVELNV